MEDNLSTPSYTWGPAYKLGRILNKYIILECFGYADKSKKIADLLHGASRNMRNLLIRNLKSFKLIIKKQGDANKMIFDHTAQE